MSTSLAETALGCVVDRPRSQWHREHQPAGTSPLCSKSKPSSKAVFAQRDLGHVAHCPNCLLVGVLLRAGCWAVRLSRAAGIWRGYLVQKNARAGRLVQKSITDTICAPANVCLSFCFAGPSRGARQAGARWAAGTSCSQHLPNVARCQTPPGMHTVPRDLQLLLAKAPQVSEHRSSC